MRIVTRMAAVAKLLLVAGGPVFASVDVPAFASPRAARMFASKGGVSGGMVEESKFLGRGMRLLTPTSMTPRKNTRGRASGSSTSLSMFMGSDGGILGVGTPELITILLVGYFVLGPSDLYKLTKEIGKFIQNFRSLGAQATATFENTMENQLELEQLRKAQQELTDAFSFRRSINFDQEASPFAEETATAVAGGAVAAEAVASGAGKKKKMKRRRVKKKVEELQPADTNGSGKIEDLDMTAAFEERDQTEATKDEDTLRQDRLDRLESGTQPKQPDWFNDSEPSIAEGIEGKLSDIEKSPSSAAEQERFAAQLSNQWNDQILANEDKLSPLSKIMERLAILEEEKNAANARLEEEFRQRSDLEESYYRRKREILEEAAVEVQADAYAGLGDEGSAPDSASSSDKGDALSEGGAGKGTTSPSASPTPSSAR